MKKSPTSLLVICGAGAQLSWLYAWASFVLFSFFHRIYPLPETLGIFCLAALLSIICRRRRWRIIQIIGIHLAGLVVAGLWVVYTFYYRQEPWWNRSWLTDFFSRPRDLMEWFLLIFVFGYTVVFWLAGIWFAHEARSYTTACSRFDRGMIAFFCLFLVKLTLQTRMGVQFHDSMALLMIFPFFMFSLTEIGFARNQGDGQNKAYLSGYYAVGVLASFAIGALIIGAAVFMFFLPYLKTASVAGYGLLKSAAGPLEPVVIAVIRFIFGYTKWGPMHSGTPALPDTPGPMGMVPAQEIILWGLGLLLLTVGLAIVGLGLWSLIKWLFKKPGGEAQTLGRWNLLTWWKQIKAFLLIFCQWILSINSRRTALQFYVALRRWGRYSGFTQEPSETPMEYGRRLSHQFPHLRPEITLIIEMLHWEIYGETALHAQQIGNIRQAWKKLHSPLRWPFRIKSAIMNS